MQAAVTTALVALADGRARRASCETTTWIRRSGSTSLSPRRRDRRTYGKAGHDLYPAGRRPADLPRAPTSMLRAVAVGRPARSAEGGEARRDRGAAAPPLPQDRPAGRRARLLAAGQYIYVGRDGRDIVWSLHDHHASANGEWYRTLNDTPGRVGPPIQPPPASVRCYFLDWLARRRLPVLAVLGERRRAGGRFATCRTSSAALLPTCRPICRGRCAGSPPSSRSISTPRTSKRSCGTRALAHMRSHAAPSSRRAAAAVQGGSRNSSKAAPPGAGARC